MHKKCQSGVPPQLTNGRGTRTETDRQCPKCQWSKKTGERERERERLKRTSNENRFSGWENEREFRKNESVLMTTAATALKLLFSLVSASQNTAKKLLTKECEALTNWVSFLNGYCSRNRPPEVLYSKSHCGTSANKLFVQVLFKFATRLFLAPFKFIHSFIHSLLAIDLTIAK